MSPINVLVAAVSRDVKAQVIAESVAARPDMNLVEGHYVAVGEVDALLKSIPGFPQCAVVLVGRPSETNEPAQRWLAGRADLVVMHVDVLGDTVRIALRDPRLDSLLTALRGLVERVGTQGQGQQRVARIQLRAIGAAGPSSAPPAPPPPPRPLLQAATEWVHQLLRDAVANVSDENGDVHGLSLTRATLLQSLDTPAERAAEHQPRRLIDAHAELDRALAAADPSAEPLARAARVFDLGPLEFRLLALALAPELDLRFQRCIGFLLDEIGRRVGTLGLYSTLLGVTAQVRAELAAGGGLARWLVFEGGLSRQTAADEALRIDPFLARWLLGESAALAHDPRVRRALRLVPWRGAAVLQRAEERARAASLIDKLELASGAPWLLLDGEDSAGWRALLELGAETAEKKLIRAEAMRLVGADVLDVEECARRIGRMARLTGAPLVLDVTKAEASESEDDWLGLFLATVACTASSAAVVCRDEAQLVRLLGATPYELLTEEPLPLAARVAAVRAAASAAEVYLSDDSAAVVLSQYPLRVDSLEQAQRLARGRPLNYELDDPRLARFTAACRQMAAEGVSNLAERIEPIFSLDQVVLPADRKQQLVEIVDNVRLAPRVLDGWKFREQLPYGRGVTALFFGPSGTGKTMAALGIARQLGIQLLRLDLSRVESKYIGDTPKNIDRVFTDAEQSGAAILIDEADALLGKRSDVKDAHDRYANIEVAYLLQRMEAYEGLAILTTNLRQNLDPAFLRRLRFIVDFPRPDVEARETIWRQCLPEAAHALDDAAFRQLARRIDLTGGHIRQITLRAAFIAAAAGRQITLEHISHAARAELAKLGMPPVELDLKNRWAA